MKVANGEIMTVNRSGELKVFSNNCAKRNCNIFILTKDRCNVVFCPSANEEEVSS